MKAQTKCSFPTPTGTAQDTKECPRIREDMAAVLLELISGTLIFPNDDRYEGNFVMGKKDGFGKYFWSNGSVYEGNFKNGQIEGKGKNP